MSTLWWFITGVGIAAYLVAWRYVAGLVAWAEKGNYDDQPGGDDIGSGLIVGFIAAPLAPFILIKRSLSDRGIGEFFVKALHTPEKYR